MERIQIEAAEPAAYQAMFALENYLGQSKLSNTHKDLVKLRASQLNRCAFCINMHTKEALKNGEDQQRIFLLDAWRDSGMFSAEEKILLQITEEVTLIHKNGLTDETYRDAIEKFDEYYLSQIIMTIVTINAWNRIAISTHKPLE
ncbi:MAG: carboxymuconolactone decarboxylase family protein [Cytophagales bacterium]|nr:carboxymuconolactone decarboxylase family protein [Cytophagales bacterium]